MQTDPTAPCGYCRRCAVHDDPAGCLTVEQWTRDNPDDPRVKALCSTCGANPCYGFCPANPDADELESALQRADQMSDAEYEYEARREYALYASEMQDAWDEADEDERLLADDADATCAETACEIESRIPGNVFALAVTDTDDIPF